MDQCPASQQDCSGQCANTQEDRNNCGACGMACGDGEVCSAGSCQLSCQSDLFECDGRCVDTDTDRANCGTCGELCGAGEVCSNGTCALSCQADLTDCSGTCVDTDTDRANCGGCNMPCDAGEVCSNGTCALSCQAGLTECAVGTASVCVDTQKDEDHCNACGSPCAAGQVCDAGACRYDTPVTLQFLTISDWHGQLDPISVNNVNVGGAAALAAYFQRERALENNTLTLTGGDAFGASPPLSSFFGEEPAVQALNLMGLSADTFGNHNFDGGLPQLQRLIDLATYPFVSSNLTNIEANLTGVVQPFHIVSIGGVKVALIGITNPDAPDLSFPNALGTMTVAEPIAAANAARTAAQAQGATVFVAMAHLGATGFDMATSTYSGPLIDLANGLTGFNLLVGDHTDFAVNTVINGMPVIENRSKGVTYARIKLTVTASGQRLSQSADLVSPVVADVTPEPAVVAMLQPYRQQLAAQLDQGIGIASNVFPRGSNIERLGEVAIGNLIAEALRARYGTQLALINGGGIRAPLPSSYLPADKTLRRTTAGYAAGPPYDLVKGDVYTVLPFGNAAVTRTVTGAQLYAMLENGVGAMPAAAGKFPQIAGFKFTYSLSAPAGSRVQSVALADGTPIANDTATYTLTTIDFLNAGGDGYTMLADGQGTTREILATVVTEAILAATTITPTTDGRITQVP